MPMPWDGLGSREIMLPILLKSQTEPIMPEKIEPSVEFLTMTTTRMLKTLTRVFLPSSIFKETTKI